RRGSSERQRVRAARAFCLASAATAPTGAPVCVPFPRPHSSFTARRTRLRLPFRRRRWRCCLERNASWCLSGVTCRLGRRQTCSSLSWTPSLLPHLLAPFASLCEACKVMVIFRLVFLLLFW